MDFRLTEEIDDWESWIAEMICMITNETVTIVHTSLTGFFSFQVPIFLLLISFREWRWRNCDEFTLVVWKKKMIGRRLTSVGLRNLNDLVKNVTFLQL